jgi:hypothetical protein
VVSWQVCALVEVIGLLRRRVAGLVVELAAARDALARHEVNEGIRQKELGRWILEAEQLRGDLEEARRERDLAVAACRAKQGEGAVP